MLAVAVAPHAHAHACAAACAPECCSVLGLKFRSQLLQDTCVGCQRMQFMQVRQAMQEKPRLSRTSTSPAQAQWRSALARAYLRTRKGAADFTAGRLGHLSVPMPNRMALVRHRSLSTGAMNAVKAAEAAMSAPHPELTGAASERNHRRRRACTKAPPRLLLWVLVRLAGPHLNLQLRWGKVLIHCQRTMPW